MRPIFISGIGTGVGKTLVSAIVVEALRANYWKPVQAGFAGGTDSEWVRSMISNNHSNVLHESYKLIMAASPHIAAREQKKTIRLKTITDFFAIIKPANDLLVVEGAGGLMVPLNDKEFIIDLISALNARVILVSRNYLGSINHSLLTAEVCRARGIDVLGWIFNDQYLNYENEIVQWSGYPALGSIPFSAEVNKDFILHQADRIRPALKKVL